PEKRIVSFGQLHIHRIDVAPAQRNVDVPRAGPGSANPVPPLRRRRPAHGAVEPGAVVVAQTWDRLGDELLDVSSDEVDPDASPGTDGLDVVGRQVDAGGLPLREVDVRARDEPLVGPERAEDRIAMDEVAELTCGDTLRDCDGWRNAADDVIELDLEVVDRCAQVP